MDDLLLETTNFDAILVGTGYTESIAAAALARAGKTVLHLDTHEYFGAHYATLNLRQFYAWIARVRAAQQQTDNGNQSDAAASSSADNTIEGKRVDVSHNEAFEILECEPETIPEDLASESSRYNIDIQSKLLFSRGELVKTLISSGVGRYLEFKCADDSFLYTKDGTFHKVPCSREDVFKDTYISLVEKRYLMKFMQFALEMAKHQNFASEGAANNESSGASAAALSLYEEYKERPFVDFLKSQNLSEKLQQFILYIIGYLHTYPITAEQQQQQQPIGQLSTRIGLECVIKTISSIGVYGNSPFLFPLYGVNELPQAFCRVAAVYAGTYVLRRGIQAVLIDDGNEAASEQQRQPTVKGVVCSQGQVLTCSHLILNRDYNTPQGHQAAKTSPNTIYRSICITDAPMIETSPDARGGVQMCVVPPLTLSDKQRFPVCVIQLNSFSVATPKNKYMLYFQTMWDNEYDALKECKSKFLSQANTPEKEITVFMTVSYKQVVRNENSELYNYANVFACSDPNGSIDVDGCLSEAKAIFDSVMQQNPPAADEEAIGFLDKLPNPEQDYLNNDTTSTMLGVDINAIKPPSLAAEASEDGTNTEGEEPATAESTSTTTVSETAPETASEATPATAETVTAEAEATTVSGSEPTKTDSTNA